MRHVHRMPFGAQYGAGGTRFALWAPSAEEVSLVVNGEEHPVPETGAGWRRITLRDVLPGAGYRYRIDGKTLVPDPASRFQPHDVFGDSLVVDPETFAWSDDGWRGRPWEEAVIYEAHVGTATPEGTFAGLAGRLETLRDLGVTAIELMPIADFLGTRNWGYDGVLPFAPDSAYGTPDDLKRLVDRAHGLGLMMMLDVVYNHFGPAGNYLPLYAKTFFTERHQTPWGAGLNVDGASGGVVRDFFVENALYWLEEYRFDGLRFDAVHAIQDDSETHIIAELAQRARAAFPDRHIHLVLENEHNEARWLGREDGRATLHTAQWNDDIHHCWHTLLTGERDAYYADFADRPVERLARCLAEGFAYQGERSANLGRTRGEPSSHLPPTVFVAFLQNHDQVGNRAFGERLAALARPEQLSLARAGLILSPQIPMLFMGEEWDASAPFQFFVDFASDTALSDAVRDGRRREFAKFPAFADPEAAARIPDPTSETTFAASKLAWEERGRAPHAEVLAETTALLRLRQDEIVPLLKSGFARASRDQPSPGSLLVRWIFGEGSLVFAANFAEAPVGIGIGPGMRPLWHSPGADIAGTKLTLSSWTGIMLKDGSRGRT
jgi:maltooligosyltrehalose trehalohydrolase